MTTPNQVLSGLTKENLLKIAKQEGVEVAQNASKEKIVNALAPLVEDTGIKKITAEFSKALLESLAKSLKLDIGESSNTKTVLAKRIFEVIHEAGVDKFLGKRSTSELKEILESLEVEASSDNKEKLAAQVEEEFNSIGIQAFLSKYETPFLQSCMKNLNLKCNTSSKSKIILALATQTPAKKDVVEREKPVFSEKKLPIKKGITYDDIFQHYLREEIVDYLKENDLKVSGTKKDLIKRILAFLDGDTKTTKAPKPDQKKSPKKKEEKKKETKEEEKEGEKPEEEEKKDSKKRKAKGDDAGKSKKKTK